ncbi:Secretogranin-2 [Liparis tanakae]|uniref:Secretogranin-2 n=1 Tax=Liparis tanakae TaxID=230148 RepID=A0A4Z2EPV9_9TELE|nr:Secretogranin-2 [Liparis tanakae]
MPSLADTSAGSLLVCFANFLSILLFLASSAAHGASLRDHRLRGGESDSQRGGGVLQTPDVDMLKALEYIQGLRQRTGPQRHDASSHTDDAEKLRAMLRLASNPMQSKEEEEEEEEEEGGQEDKSEELLQAVLSTLQRTEEASKPAAAAPGPLPHEKLPLMFEDEEEDEEGEGDEGEKEEGGRGRQSPFKRTNENVEEKYTPQNLATLQSVFDELDKMTSVKAEHRRQDEEEEEEEEGDQEEDDDDEEEEDKQEADRGLDYAGDEEEAGEDDEEDPEESYPVKRSSDADDVANLVDYYLLRVLEKTEEEARKKREEEEEEEEEKQRRAARPPYGGGDMDPRAVYQLIQISQKYRIPPEDLVDMLRTGETMSQDMARKSGGFSRAPGGERSRVLPPKKKTTHRIPEAKFYSRQQTPEERRTEEILSILGLGAEDRAPARKQKSSPPPPPPSQLRAAGRPWESAAAARRRPAPPKNDYEDELAAFLEAQMLPRYRGRGGEAAGQKRAAAAASSFERTAQAYLDRMDTDNIPDEKRRSDGEEEEEETMFDNEAVMKMLSSLNPETEESDDTTDHGI